MKSLWLDKRKVSYRKDVPDPVPGNGEALIQVVLAGICSTDLELLRGYYPFTGVPGHEFVGRVLLSPDEPGWVDKRVVGEINISCGQCEMCKLGLRRHCENRRSLGIHDWNGVFAEMVVLPIENLHIVPENVPNEKAVFTEPLAAAVEILEQTKIEPFDNVLIVGAGRLGLLVAMVLRQTGCQLELVVRHQKQRELLNKLEVPILSEEDIAAGKYDVVVEATGSPDGLSSALKAVRPRGRIILKSTYHGNTEVNFSQIVVNEVTLIGSRCGPFEPALSFLKEGKVDPQPLIEAIYPVEDGVNAFDYAAKPGVLKVLLQTGTANFTSTSGK